MPSSSAVPKTANATNYENLVRRFVAQSGIPCLGEPSKLREAHIEICIASSIYSTECNGRILSGLYEFIADYRSRKSPFRSFALVFEDALEMSEEEFELSLWTRLQSLHDDDSYAWETGVAEDQDDHAYRFSAGNHTFHIACLHPEAKSRDRRAPLPVAFMSFQEQVKDLKNTESLAKETKSRRTEKTWNPRRPLGVLPQKRLKVYEIAY